MSSSVSGADQRTVSLWDGIAVFWVIFWLVVGLATGAQIWQLSHLSDTAEISARAVDSAGAALQSLSDIPLVGDGPGDLGDDVRAAAAELERSAGQTREDVHRLSVLLGLSIFLIPISPVLGLYLPLRLRRRSHIAAIRRELVASRGGPALEAYLAHQAVNSMSYGELMVVSPDPAQDLVDGRHSALAAAELARLGLPSSPR